MIRILSITCLCLFMAIGSVVGQDMLPSDVYYKDNIAVNNVSAESPSLKAPGDEGLGGPGGSGESWGGGGVVISPIGDAALPLLAIGLLYGVFICYRKTRKSL